MEKRFKIKKCKNTWEFSFCRCAPRVNKSDFQKRPELDPGLELFPKNEKLQSPKYQKGHELGPERCPGALDPTVVQQILHRSRKSMRENPYVKNRFFKK